MIVFRLYFHFKKKHVESNRYVAKLGAPDIKSFYLQWAESGRKGLDFSDDWYFRLLTSCDSFANVHDGTVPRSRPALGLITYCVERSDGKDRS